MVDLQKIQTDEAVSKFNIVIRDITRQQKQYKNEISSIKLAKNIDKMENIRPKILTIIWEHEKKNEVSYL